MELIHKILENLVGFVHGGLNFLIPLIILLGLLIFVHEMGHFLVAKYFGVRVEVFSLGFGKKIFKFKRGDTEYCISIIPFGGYVKMFGDELGTEISEEDKKFAFNYKPVGQRIWIVLAGPLMNFFFAILLFGMIAVIGEDIVGTTLGDISKNTPAYQAGLRSGDTIKSINNISVNTWDEFQEELQKHENSLVSIEAISHEDGSVKKIETTTALVKNKNILSDDEYVGDIEGLGFLSRATSVGISNQNSLAANAGVKTGYIINSVNKIPVERWIDLEDEISKNLSTRTTIILELVPNIEKPKDSDKIELTLESFPTVRETLSNNGIESSSLFVSKVVDQSAASKAGFKENDKVLSIDGDPVELWEELVSKVQKFDPKNNHLAVSVLRAGAVVELNVTPELTKQQDPAGKEIEVYAMGIMTAAAIAPPKTFLVRTTNPFKASIVGFQKTLHWTKMTVLSFLRLIQNKVSAKSIGGPIMIGQLASKTFQIGMSAFLKIMAIISINLFVLNLLPIPILDGGHLLFYFIEALRGAPLSMRKMEIAQQVGLVLLMGLMVFALFNDITRLFQ